MTKNDLIQMADLVGYDVDDDDDVHAPASGRYGLDPRLEHFAQLVAGYTLRYECPKQSTDKSINDAVQKAIAIEQEACAKHYLEIMRNAVEQATLREREACAKLCEDLFLSDGEWCARSIRARDMYKKQENSDMSEECVHESDKSIHQAWDTSDMAHRSGGLSVEQEPVAWMYVNEDGKCEQIEYGVSTVEAAYIKLLYTTPQSKPWVSLTDEEIFTINHKAATDYEDGLTYARAIEATLRSKNT